MSEPEYASDAPPIYERVAAALLTAVWIALAFRIGGLGLAIRAGLLFGLALCCVCLPGIMAQEPGRSSDRNFLRPVPASPAAVRLIGWLVILGVPAFWLVCSLVLPPR